MNTLQQFADDVMSELDRPCWRGPCEHGDECKEGRVSPETTGYRRNPVVPDKSRTYQKVDQFRRFHRHLAWENIAFKEDKLKPRPFYRKPKADLRSVSLKVGWMLVSLDLCYYQSPSVKC